MQTQNEGSESVPCSRDCSADILDVIVQTYVVSSEYVDCMIQQEIQRRSEWIANWFGPRCSDFEPTCIVCRLWDLHDQFIEAAGQ